MREHFHFFAHGLNNSVRPNGAYVILDTNVLSVVSSMAINGYDRGKPEHVRAANLFRWLIRYDVSLVQVDFALVEGSGFHSGGINYYTLKQRYMPFEALRLLTLQELEAFIESGKGVNIQADADVISGYLRDNLVAAQESVLKIFGPCYATSLAIHQARAEQVDDHELLHRVTSVLEKQLNLVLAVPWLTAALAAYGKSDLKQRLLQEVFKTGSRRIRQSVLSAAWDLAYLQSLSMLSLQAREHISTTMDAILVTDDSALKNLADMLKSDGTHFMAPSPELLNPSHQADLEKVGTELRARRLLAQPTPTSKQTLEAACSPLENSLGIAHLSFQVEAVPVTMPLDTSLLYAITNSVKNEGEALLEALKDLSQNGDLLVHALFLTQHAVLDNSRQRSRTAIESAAAISGFIRETTGFSGLPIIGERLTWAFTREDHFEIHALLYQVEVVDEELYGAALLYVCAFLRRCWLDTSEFHGETLDHLIDQIAERLMQNGNRNADVL